MGSMRLLELHVTSEHVFVNFFHAVDKRRKTLCIYFATDDLAASVNARTENRAFASERIEDGHAGDKNRIEDHLVDEFEWFCKWVGLHAFVWHTVDFHVTFGHWFGEMWGAFLHDHDRFVRLGWILVRRVVFAGVRFEPEEIPVENLKTDLPPPGGELFLVLLGIKEEEISVWFENTVSAFEKRFHLIDVLLNVMSGPHHVDTLHVFEQVHVDAVGNVGDDGVDGFRLELGFH